MKKYSYSLIIIFIITAILCIYNRSVEYKKEVMIDKYFLGEGSYTYLLNIPKINLKEGIYSIGDVNNTVDKSVMIHEESDNPDKEKSNVILVAHSGTGPKAYFNDLNKLDTDSLIEFYYDGIKYVYMFDNSYSVLKNGSVNIVRDKNKKSITLITCSKSNHSIQDVYIGYLIDEVIYE